MEEYAHLPALLGLCAHLLLDGSTIDLGFRVDFWCMLLVRCFVFLVYLFVVYLCHGT